MYSSDLASNEEAWQEAREAKGINSSVTFPSDDVVWATASTQDSNSWMHIDDHGFATSVKVITGLKYWVLASGKQDENGQFTNGDLGSIRAFMGWEPDVAHGAWDLEGVLLGPGDIL